MKKIEVLDSTLREGEQRDGINFSLLDKLKILTHLDSLGLDFIEVPSPNFGQNTREFWDKAMGLRLSAKLVVFGRTCKPGTSPANDTAVSDLLSVPAEYTAVYGKVWKKQVETVLKTEPRENIRILSETIAYLKANGKKVFFDAEHFFDGYTDDKEYVIEVINAAEQSGADLICLCDTRGGFFPDDIRDIINEVKPLIHVKTAIHMHNDSGMADAATCEAAFCGIDQIQGTINGIGERCGNATLATCIANLQIKKGFDLIPADKLANLTKATRAISQICNISTSGKPYISRNAFSHKAGTHIDAMQKDSTSFEHIEPHIVGNKRNLVISGLSGKSAILPLIQTFAPELDKNSPETDKLLETIKEHESLGYQYEAAPASLELLVRKTLGIHKTHFRVERFKLFTEQTKKSESNAPVIDDKKQAELPMGLSSAFVKVSVNNESEMTAAESDGPVNALDNAMRKALYVFYPQLKDVQLIDFKVRIIDGSSASDAVVRVLIDTEFLGDTFTTVGVSADIIEASKQALIDSLEYALYKSDNT